MKHRGKNVGTGKGETTHRGQDRKENAEGNQIT